MKKISTGQDSTLGTYRDIAKFLCLNLCGKGNHKAVEFFEKKIKDSKNGENEEVIAEESQVIYLIMKLIKEELDEQTEFNEENTNEES